MSFAEIIWRRIQHGLDLSRLTAGESRSWTVRLAHGVYLVRLDQAPIGNRLFVDDRELARTRPWDFEQPLRFDLGEARGEVRFIPDTRRGTLGTELRVDGETVPPDRPIGLSRRLPPVPWKSWAELAAYATGGALVLGGLVGDPLAAVVGRAVWTFALLVWSSGLAAIDPFGLVPFVVEHGLAGQPSMIVAGSEIALAGALARDRLGLRRFVPPLRDPRWYVRAAGWLLVAAAAVGVLAIVG